MLRADRLSCYKDQKEYKIHRQIFLADVTAIATLKDAKRPNIFGIFSEARNFHFRAASHEETSAWVDTIRDAAKVGESEEFYLGSPMSPTQPPVSTLDRRLGSSASEGPHKVGAGRVSSQTLDYSGPELGSEPSLEDVTRMSQLSLSHFDQGFTSGAETVDRRTSLEPSQGVKRNDSGLSLSEQLPRVIWHGYLYCLKSKGGVKQWKKYWVVVKNINIAFYKTEEVCCCTHYTLDSIANIPRNTALSRSSPSKTSSMPSKSTRSQNLKSTACKSSPKAKPTASPRPTKTSSSIPSEP